jgi:gliding motility-associated-like protein
VVAENELGCRVEDSVMLRSVGCDSKMVYLPNTFTPNGDGVNDKLFVRGIGLKQLEFFRIFDRWGNVVFFSDELNNGWDGTSNGKPADINTYVYMLKGVCTSGATIELNGNVTLVR